MKLMRVVIEPLSKYQSSFNISLKCKTYVLELLLLLTLAVI